MRSCVIAPATWQYSRQAGAMVGQDRQALEQLLDSGARYSHEKTALRSRFAEIALANMLPSRKRADGPYKTPVSR
jgi:hypothetical protein